MQEIDVSSKVIQSITSQSDVGGKCFACLKSSHVSKECTDRAKYRTCSKRYPTSLHFDKTGIGTNTEDTISCNNNDYRASNA